MALFLTENELMQRLETQEQLASGNGCGVAAWPFDRLAKLFRKQKRYSDEVRILERYAAQKKQPGAVIHELMLRLEHAKALRDGTLQELKAKRASLLEVSLYTPLGVVTLKNPHQHAAVVVALGQKEEHITWYFDVHQKNILERAVENLRIYESGNSRMENWTASYIEFIKTAPEALKMLADEKYSVIEENRRRIRSKEASVVATYPTLEEARIAAKYCTEMFAPRLWYGWLDVHVVELAT